MAKARTKKPEKVNWKADDVDASGNLIRESMDGMLRMRRSDQCEGVKLPTRWQLWRYVGGQWKKVKEERSEKKVDDFARVMAEAIANDDE